MPKHTPSRGKRERMWTVVISDEISSWTLSFNSEEVALLMKAAQLPDEYSYKISSPSTKTNKGKR